MAADARESARERLLFATLSHVAFDGWTRTALLAGAKDAGASPATVLDLFPGGMAELIEYYNRLADLGMAEALATLDLSAMKVRERVATAVRLRLEQNASHREAVRQGLSFLALPQNMALGARCLYRTVDAIWYAAGDRSTDHNFYTKRGLLAGVYGATVLYWLNDKSPEFGATWAFLGRRIADLMRVPPALGRLAELARKLPDPFRILARRRAGR